MKKSIHRLSAFLLTFLLSVAALVVPVSASGYGIRAESKTTDSIKLIWEDQSKAEAYRVYIYDTAKKKFTAYKTVASNQCTVTDLKPDTSYKFQVRALKKNKKGKYAKLSQSGTVTVKTLAKPASSGGNNNSSGSKKKTKKTETAEAADADTVMQQYRDAVFQLNCINSEIDICERNIILFEENISRIQNIDNPTERDRKELYQNQVALADTKDRLRDLTRQRAAAKNDVDRLRTTLHIMGITNI